ncbi:MAG: glycine--tRNA ligase subunit beta [Coriobacteriia bacterium]|nr:glycine--tRNA ligase subunit beta [Coriobacteriia bacterium]
MTTKTLAYEIGVEEIPAFDLNSAIKQLHALVPKLLDDAAIPHGQVEVFDSPRRLIVLVHDVPAATEATEEVFKGPSTKIAFDAEGNPTKAALGFARGKGLTADDLTVKDGYVYARKSTPSIQVTELLPAVLDGTIRGLAWPRSQRWGSQHDKFVRPVRWMVALFGDEVVDFSFAGLTAGRNTYGHRFLAPGPFTVAGADELLDVVRAAKVIPSEHEREAIIREGVSAIEDKTGYKCVLHPKTLVEVVNLCEYPTVLMGTFDEEFLAVPEEIIVDAMLVHQRYFPLYDAEGKLVNHFLVVGNGNPECSATITDGNERVVRARLYDAKFFYDEDLKKPLADYVPQLSEVVFQEKLGTVLEKTERIQRLAEFMAADAGLSGQDAADASRAAYLCKADLVTGAVVEFTSVQGIMGSYYAKAAGETDQVAEAIQQHYMPRFAGDDVPATTVGKIVAVADKLDSICGMFAVGQGPTGSSDPFALRRSAIGVVNMLKAGLDVSLVAAIDESLASYDKLEFDRAAVKAEVIDFFVTRTRVMLKDAGTSVDAIDAVLACGVAEPVEVMRRVEALEAARANDTEAFEDLAIAYARANNLRDPELGDQVNEGLLNEDERSLLAATNAAKLAIEKALDQGSYECALTELSKLRGPIDAFFAAVMVNDEDEALRTNRHCLLNGFVSVFANIADFGVMAKTK